MGSLLKAEYISHQGDDLAVVQAARVSFDKTSDWEHRIVDTGEGGDDWYYERYLSERDTKLINYLAKHDHFTPFCHNSISLRMSAPIPIARQAYKHKVGFVENEESRRYISSRPELFVPEYFRSKPEGSIKQGSGGEHIRSIYWLEEYNWHCTHMVELYEMMVDDGVCPEQARFILPQGVEVNWIWTGNLFAFANFYKKRTDPNAQVEIQQLARQVATIVEPLFPVSWRALVS